MAAAITSQHAALADGGTDGNGRIIAAPDRRPRLRNLAAAEVAHFRAHVEVIGLIGTTDPGTVVAAARQCAARDPGPAPEPPGGPAVPVQRAAPPRTVADPAGYLVVHADAARKLLIIEHYRNDGLLTTIIEAASPADGYTSVLAAGLVTRLDHAAYLGRELARAEQALRDGTTYRQDAGTRVIPTRQRQRPGRRRGNPDETVSWATADWLGNRLGCLNLHPGRLRHGA